MGTQQTTKITRSKRKRPDDLVDPESSSHLSELPSRRTGVQLSLPIGGLLEGVKGALEHVATQAGLLVIQALLEDEVEGLTGPRYQHDDSHDCHRWGRDEGHVIMDGKKLPIHKPRVRGPDGEVRLNRYQMFRNPDAIQESMGMRIINGLSTRRYGAVVDEFSEGFGIEKSSVSRGFKAVSERELAALTERPLDDLDIIAIMLDGVEFAGNVIIVGLGIDIEGRKHILGLWSGATENATVCGELLDDCIHRGLDAEKRYLFVLDGSRALRKAVVSRWGDRAIIQRCRLHKQRNILDQLPKEKQSQVLMRLRAAWGMTSYDDAKKALEDVRNYLKGINEAAANSLDEAFEETLTLHRLGVPPVLRKSIMSTNPIESCFSGVRDLCKNVRRWRDMAMVRRWAGTGLLAIEKKFRRIRGYKSMSVLVTKIRTLDLKQATA